MRPDRSLKIAQVILVVVMLCLTVVTNRNFELRSRQAWKFERWYETIASPKSLKQEILKQCQIEFQFNSQAYSLSGSIDGAEPDKLIRLLSLLQNSNLLSLEKPNASNYFKVKVPGGSFVAKFDASDINNNPPAQNLLKLLEIYEIQKRIPGAIK